MTTPPAGAPQDALEKAHPERISVSLEPLAVFRHDRSLFIPNGLPEYVLTSRQAEAEDKLRRASAVLKLARDAIAALATTQNECGFGLLGKLMAPGTLDKLDEAIALLSAPKAQEKKE